MGLTLALQNRIGPTFTLNYTYLYPPICSYMSMYANTNRLLRCKMQPFKWENRLISHGVTGESAKHILGPRNPWKEFQRLGKYRAQPGIPQATDGSPRGRPSLAKPSALHSPPQPVPSGASRYLPLSKGREAGWASRGRPHTTRRPAPTPAINSDPPPRPTSQIVEGAHCRA